MEEPPLTKEEANRPDKEGQTWLITAIMMGQKEIPDHVWDVTTLKRKNSSGWCPLSAFLFQRRGTPLPTCLPIKEVIACDAEGENPLHWFAKWGHEQETLYFLSLGANPLARNKNGKTPAELVNFPETSPIPKMLESAAKKYAQKYIQREEELTL